MNTTSRGRLSSRAANTKEQGMKSGALGRLACALGFHRVITRDNRKKGAADFTVHGFCYRTGCAFEFDKTVNFTQSSGW